MKQPLPPRALALAPMVGLSHRALRELILGFEAPEGLPGGPRGMDLAYTEMASAGAVTGGSPYEAAYLDPGPEPSRVVYQLFATKPERLPEALLHLGDRPVFGADLNFGCAAPHITRAGGGAAWMREPEKAFALARSAREAWKGSLSAKLRIGAEDDYGRLKEFCLGLAEAGLDFLCLHPRLEGEKFRRQGRWDYVGRLARDLPLPLLGNGDVRSPEDYERRMREEEPAGIMIGREAVRRPWIFSLIHGREADPAFSLRVDLKDTALRFLDLVEALLPPDFHETRAKRFLYYFADNFSFAHHLRWKWQNAPDLGAMRAILEDYLREQPGDRFKEELPGTAPKL